ncbi:OLC1v1012553C1 [Oldenlandia corymbosa var. corymbosa]|uniref:OLC1v1012553C1 n=1 Tax=Oldenlandia corymbosa var. corymbosa TaxID=529605 RepID=A0AAV1DWE6_OLDCO|nr:OLC1v1012553C1 [Oldenlandia corymbosa var. corymbosa]
MSFRDWMMKGKKVMDLSLFDDDEGFKISEEDVQLEDSNSTCKKVFVSEEMEARLCRNWKNDRVTLWPIRRHKTGDGPLESGCLFPQREGGDRIRQSPVDKGSTSTQARGTKFDLLISLGDDGEEDQLGAAVPEKMDDESNKTSTPPTQSLSFLGARKASTREQISSTRGGARPLPKTQKKPNMSHNPTEMAQNSATPTQQQAQQVASNPISFQTAETQKAPQAQKEFTAHLAPTTLDLPTTK